jgi:hypothetical protein
MTFQKKAKPASPKAQPAPDLEPIVAKDPGPEPAPVVVPTAPEVKAEEPQGEKTIIVPSGTEVTVSDPGLVEAKYLRVVAIREMWRGGIKHAGTQDYRLDGPNPVLSQNQIDAIWSETRKPKPGLSVSEVTKFEPAEAE